MDKRPTHSRHQPNAIKSRWRAVALVVVLTSCGTDDVTYTLYRSSPVDPNMRLHIASFDASQKEEYNSGNCDIAANLFRAQPGVTVKYWCEKGRYRK
jgi:hypothetical protein